MGACRRCWDSHRDHWEPLSHWQGRAACWESVAGCQGTRGIASQTEGSHSVPAGPGEVAELCARAMTATVAVVEAAVESAQRCCQTRPDPAAVVAAEAAAVAAVLRSKSVGSDSNSAGQGFAARPVRMDCSRD